jgi:hypothetical protein
MLAKSKNINLFLKETKKVADASVTIDFPCKLNDYTLACLKAPHGTTDDKHVHDSLSILAYSIYECAELALRGNPLAVSKSRVSSVGCAHSSGKFVIHFNTHGSLTYVRKASQLVIKCMDLKKLWPSYDKNTRSLGNTPNKSIFNHCANALSSGLSKLQISVIGKVSLKKTKDGKAVPPAQTLDTLVKAIDKLPKHTTLSPASKHPAATDQKAIDCVELKAKGVDALLLTHYLQSAKLRTSMDSTVKVYLPKQQWSTLVSKLKDQKKITAFITQKFMHKSLKEHLPALFAYSAGVSGLSSADVRQIASAKFTLAQLVGKIKKSLS